jgi:putative sigma-54 modulation protein
MKYQLSAIGFTITPAIESSVAEHSKKLAPFHELDSGRHRIVLHGPSGHAALTKAEAILHIAGKEIFAHAADADLYQAIHQLFQKLEAQMRKEHEKRVSHKLS